MRSSPPSGAVFAPAPLLTITIERRGTSDEVHLHAGGQGFWLARMVVALGTPVTLCATLGGEVGAVVRGLADREGVTVRAIESEFESVAHVHDRRSGNESCELTKDGRAVSRDERRILDAIEALRDQGVGTVVVSRAELRTLATVGDMIVRIRSPHVEPADHHGTGDSMRYIRLEPAAPLTGGDVRAEI